MNLSMARRKDFVCMIALQGLTLLVNSVHCLSDLINDAPFYYLQCSLLDAMVLGY